MESSDLEYKKLGNIQLPHLVAAEHAPYDSEPEEIMKSYPTNGEILYWIPSGAGDRPLGGAGYARCAFEIVQQERELGVHFDTVIVACAGGSTLAGLIAGFKLIAETSTADGESRKQRQMYVQEKLFTLPYCHETFFLNSILLYLETLCGQLLTASIP